MSYPTTFPPEAADQHALDLAERPAPRLTGPREVARRLADLDEAYLRATFVPLDELSRRRGWDPNEVRALVRDGALPQPAYRLDDGTDLVPEDFFGLAEQAGGVDDLPGWFQAEYRTHAGGLGLPADDEAAREQWHEYLSGGYFVCLRRATPAMIARKAWHVTALRALLEDPLTKDPHWQADLRRHVDGLAEIEREGAVLDPPRWGGPTSQQWYGSFLRTWFPAAFAIRARQG